MASRHLWATKVAADDSSAKEQVGVLRREWDSSHKAYKYYKYVPVSLVTLTATTNGVVLYCYNNGCTVVTNDISTTKPGIPAGVATGTITDGQYGWIQVGGYHSAVDTNGDDDISKGDFLVGSFRTDGTCDSVAAGTATSAKILGVATADDIDGSNTVAAMLDCSYGQTIP